MNAGSVIVGGARTPIGRMLGSLSTVKATDLGAAAISGALERAGISGTDVDRVIMGQVLPAGCGQGPARQAAAAAGIPMEVQAITINKLCLSGIQSIIMADQLIRLGEADVVVAGGMESMSQAPHLLTNGRTGHKYGSFTTLDHMETDGLWDAFIDAPMGLLTEQRNSGDLEVSRADQDAMAVRSHQKAAAGAERLAEEIVEVRVPGRRGQETVVTTDEGVRADTTAESLGKLRPAFSKDGTITAGSASQISDGAAAVVVMSREAAERLGCTVMAEIVADGQVAGPDSSLQLQPANAIRKALERAEMDLDQMDLIEINEAFAAVGLTSARDLGFDEEAIEAKLNVNGGAIALGHPIGASGTRVVLTLMHELGRRGGGAGVAALCGGGGQGDALIVRVP